nr:plasmid pRiA4b ORF-3 family protein [Nocardioides agariphilus]
MLCKQGVRGSSPLGSTISNPRHFDLDEGEDGTLEDDVRLDQFLAQKGDELWYERDFGDGWDHKLVVEEPP